MAVEGDILVRIGRALLKKQLYAESVRCEEHSDHEDTGANGSVPEHPQDANISSDSEEFDPGYLIEL